MRIQGINTIRIITIIHIMDMRITMGIITIRTDIRIINSPHPRKDIGSRDAGKFGRFAQQNPILHYAIRAVTKNQRFVIQNESGFRDTGVTDKNALLKPTNYPQNLAHLIIGECPRIKYGGFFYGTSPLSSPTCPFFPARRL